MTHASPRAKAALLVDLETIAGADRDGAPPGLQALITEAERWGDCVVRRAYADWTRHRGHGEALAGQAVDLTQLFPAGGRSGRGQADRQLVVDAMELALTRPQIDVFVLVGGEADLAAVARRLRGLGRRVIGIGSGSAQEQAWDHFVPWGRDRGQAEARRSPGAGLEAARALLQEAMRRRSAQAPDGLVLAAALKHGMLGMDATFDEVALGFPQFRDFLEAQADLVETRQADKQLWVAPRARAGDGDEADPWARHRAALRSAELRIVDPAVRRAVLRDMHRLLEDFPGEYTLQETVQELVSRYDAEGIARDRNQVRDIAKLARFADVFEPVPESFQLDPLTLAEGADEADFVERCECIYVMAFLESRLPVEAEMVAAVLFDGLDDEAPEPRARRLAEAAAEQLAFNHVELPGSGWRWPAELLAQPELAAICAEIEACPLDEPASVLRALSLSDQGHAVRPKSFEQAKGYFQQAARMTLELLRQGEPGASLMDLETYIASYCFAAAGAHYLGFEYARASQDYLAFFNLLRENRPVWDKMFGLVPPMLSYYFSTVLRALREPVAASPGFTHPANMAIQLHAHPNPEARSRWLELVADLRRVNPMILRLVADRLVQLDHDRAEEGAAETLEALREAA